MGAGDGEMLFLVVMQPAMIVDVHRHVSSVLVIGR
jgi:hypothetical protein